MPKKIRNHTNQRAQEEKRIALDSYRTPNS